MAILTERIECKEFLDKLMPVEEAVKFVSDRCKIAISGFTKTVGWRSLGIAWAG